MRQQFNTIIRITIGAFAVVLDRRLAYARALALPIAALIVLDQVLLLVSGPRPLIALAVLAYLLVSTNIAITTHRVTLLGADSVARFGNLNAGKREAIFLVTVLTVVLVLMAFLFASSVLMVLMLLVSGIAEPERLAASRLLALGLTLPAVWIVARLSLVFPATALDKDLGLLESWRLTQKHQAVMLYAMVLFPGLSAVPGLILDVLEVTLAPPVVVLLRAINVVMTVIGLTLMSLAYSEITAERKAKPEE